MFCFHQIQSYFCRTITLTLFVLKKITILIAGSLVGLVGMMNVLLNVQSHYLSDLALTNVEALGEDESSGTAPACEICGNCTFIPYSQLELRGCWLGLAGQHLKCMSGSYSCCNPSEQTPCGGI